MARDMNIRTDTDIIERLPPQATEAERAVLG